MEKNKSAFGRVKAQRIGSFRKPAAKVEKMPVIQRDYALADKRDFIHSVPVIMANSKKEMVGYMIGYAKAFFTGAHRVAVK